MSEATPPIPKWREDFPVESETDDYITRRDFMRFLLLVSGGLMVGSGSILAKSLRPPHAEAAPTPVKLCDVADMPPGTSRVFRYPDDKTPVLLIRRQNGEFLSYGQKCTHLACPVLYAPADGTTRERLVCHCHNGAFNLETGEGVSGPPRDLRPLTRVNLDVRDGSVYAVGLDRMPRA